MTKIPFVKDLDFTYGKPSRLSPLIQRIIANNPGPFTYTGTGTYLVGSDGPLAVIDPGPHDPDHMNALNSAAPNGISHILVTHTHHDHCGGARLLAERTGAPIFGFGPHPKNNPAPLDDHALEEGGDENFSPDQLISDGDIIEGTDWSLEAVHTPGHLSNHLCFALDQEKTLFTGDHIMGWATTVIIPPTGHMGAYFDSLEKLLARNDELYLPTHGAPIKTPHRFVRAVRTHRRVRDGQIIEQLKSGHTQIKDMVAAMYADVDKRLHGAASMNVLAHLIRLVETGIVKIDGQPSLNADFQIA